MAKKGLGRGLDALLADNAREDSAGVTMLRLADIEPNLNQVRKSFDPDAIAELAESIRVHGLIQPIVVRKMPDGFYEIIAGERRWRACKAAGLNEVPVIVRDSDDRASSFIAMVENLQRENLNPVEEAMGYKKLAEEYALTQEEIAEKVGKSRPAISNIMRILDLPEQVLDLVRDGLISYGHARTLLPLSGKVENSLIFETANKIIASEMSVRETEKYVKILLEAPRSAPKASKVRSSYYRQLEDRASSKLGRKLNIKESPSGNGKITLAFSSSQDLEVLMKFLCGNNFFENTGD